MSGLTQILNVILWIPRKLLLALNFSFGGLAAGFYIRHLIFGVLVSVCVVVTSTLLLKFVLPLLSEPNPYFHQVTSILRFIVKESQPTPSLGVILFTALYPYSRFAFGRVMGFLTGSHQMLMPLKTIVVFGLIKTLLCWFLIPVLAPVGLLTLFCINLSRSRSSQHTNIATQNSTS